MAVASSVPLSINRVPSPDAIGAILPEMFQVEPPVTAGRTSQMLKLYRSVLGAVSLMVTVVPLLAVTSVCLCTQ